VRFVVRNLTRRRSLDFSSKINALKPDHGTLTPHAGVYRFRADLAGPLAGTLGLA
jgi:hypothetical protein